jgi:hypothetical protein
MRVSPPRLRLPSEMENTRLGAAVAQHSRAVQLIPKQRLKIERARQPLPRALEEPIHYTLVVGAWLARFEDAGGEAHAWDAVPPEVVAAPCNAAAIIGVAAAPTRCSEARIPEELLCAQATGRLAVERLAHLDVGQAQIAVVIAAVQATAITGKSDIAAVDAHERIAGGAQPNMVKDGKLRRPHVRDRQTRTTVRQENARISE